MSRLVVCALVMEVGWLAVGAASPEAQRAEVSSSFFVVTYVALSVPVIGVGAVAQGGGEVDHGLDAAHRVAERAGVGEIAERDLNADPLLAEAARISDQAADGRAAGRQPPQQGHSDRPGRAGQQQHQVEGIRRIASCRVPGPVRTGGTPGAPGS